MVERDSFTNNINNGDQLNEGYFQGIGYNTTPLASYTGTAFDSLANVAGNVATSSTDTNSHDITISASDLAKFETGVLFGNIGLYSYSMSTSSGFNLGSYTNLKIEIGETGGSLSTIYDENNTREYNITLLFKDINSGITPFVHTLTAGELTNGVTIRITTTSFVQGDGTESSGNFVRSEVKNLGTLIFGY